MKLYFKKEKKVVLWLLCCGRKLWWIVVFIERDKQMEREGERGKVSCYLFSFVFLFVSYVHTSVDILFIHLLPFFFFHFLSPLSHFIVSPFLCFPFLSFFHLSSSSLFNTLPSPLHLDFMPHMCFLFSPSLCAKVELMNDRACHQFPSFPLHLSYTHTHTVYWSVKQQQQQLCVFSPVKPLLLFPLSQFWVSWNNIYWLHN